MRAALYAGNETIVMEDRKPDSPGPGEVRLDVAYTGICGTDLHILHGGMDQRVSIPAVLGHEMSGRVAAVGGGVDQELVRQPVTVMPLRWCGQCPACRAGHSHICQRSRVEPLANAPAAFAALAGGGGVMKVLIDCQAWVSA